MSPSAQVNLIKKKQSLKPELFPLKMNQFSCLKNTFLAPESEKKSTMHISVCKLSPIYTEFEVFKIECIYLCFNI